MRVLSPEEAGTRVPIFVWAREVPRGALEQLRLVASQPYVVHRVAAMPDLHVSAGVAVGSVFATEDTIVPSALGGDLGCGMTALRFPFPAASLSRRALEALISAFAHEIPVGDATHRGRGRDVPQELLDQPLATRELDRTRDRLARRHLGTLGGGNHFVELDRDGAGDLWLLVHSGSRGLGSAVADHHIRVARALGRGELPGLSVSSPEGAACVRDLEWALRFALANRTAITTAAAKLVERELGVAADEASRIDVHHNFAAEELHFGTKCWVHRKGAIRASADTRALIPGSMGSATYVVEGLANPEALESGSHGAGRVMTRGEARRSIAPARFRSSMRRVVFDPHRERTLIEEAPDAYRDIVEVLEDERDLVRPVLRLEPLAVLKG